MGYSINEIEGIGKTFKRKLKKVGIGSTDALLKLCCDKKGRRAVSKESGLTEKQLLKWANMGDLMRIKGVGKQFSELLEAAGVDTVKELRSRRPDNLTEKMGAVNAKKKLARVAPSLARVEKWVAQAKKLKPVITH